MKKIDILFLCSANVGRSQMAEGYYNFYFKKGVSQSAALIEDKREKYKNSPAAEIRKIMKQDGVDISQQEISIISSQKCNIASKIIILSDIKSFGSPDFLIQGLHPLDFIYRKYSYKVFIFPIKDPYKQNEKSLQNIRNSIKKIVKNL